MRELYTELVEKSIQNRGNIISIDNLKVAKADYERYCSLFSFDSSIIEHISNTGSISNFNSEVCVRNIWVDFDHSSNLDSVLQEAIKFIERLATMYSLTPSHFPLFFSGNKGFHVSINSKLIGLDNVFDKDLPAKIKSYIQFVSDGIKYVDYVIYNSTRIFRLPFSINAKSNLYKIYLPYDVAKSSSIEQIIEYARECKMFKMQKVSYELNKNMNIDFNKFSSSVPDVKIIDKPKKENKAETVAEKKDNNSLNNTSLFKIPDVGQRNDTLYKQAYRLFSVNDLKVNEVYDIMNIIYSQTVSSTGDLPYKEYVSLINSAFNRSRGNSNNGEINIKNVENLSIDVFDIISNSACVPTFITDIDEDLGGGLKLGNLYPFIGKSGSKKSMLAQEIAIRNCMKGDITIYFNMEMSFVELFRRTALRVLNRDIYNEIRNGVINKEDMVDIHKMMSENLKNNFYAVDNSDLTVDQMKSIISDVEEKTGKKVKLVVIDSMNSMKSINGNETFTAFENTKKLKELAKHSMCATIMINHVTQSCLGHVRDVSLFVRGGAKIIDNCDAWFGFSKVIDKLGSILDGDNPDIKYLDDLMYIRFYNKRESGATIDTIAKLHDDLSVEFINENPRDYEV